MRAAPSPTPRHEDEGTAGSVASADPSAVVRLHDPAGCTGLHEGLTQLWLGGEGCDITIRVRTTQGRGAAAAAGTSVAATEVKAHRVVLAAVSAPLHRMIFGNMASVDEENVLTLGDAVDAAALQSVVQYAYTATLEFTQDTVWRVLKACMFLELEGATKLCTEFLSTQLTPANVLGVAKAAEALHCAELEAAALVFTNAHMAAVSLGAEWLEMPLEEAVSLACETHPLSIAVPRVVVIKALGRWVEFAPDERWVAFEQCMASGEALAQCNLGMCYEHGWGVAQDSGKAVECYIKVAEQGHASGQHRRGLCYQHGMGVVQDRGKAAEWFTKAAEQGLAVGQFHLGISYERGMRGVAQDRGKAVEWYTKAADQGHADAQLSLDRFGLDR